MKIKALPGKVLVDDIERGERLIGRIIIPNDNGKSSGIRPRWARVYSVGDDITGIEPGQWILVLHGQWTRATLVKDDDGNEISLWRVNWPDGVLAVADEPEGTTFSEFSPNSME